MHPQPAELLSPDGEWDQLLSASNQPTVFLTSAWLRAVRDVLHPDSPLIAPVAYQDGRLVAAGLFVADNGTVQFLGTGPCDYLDMLTHASLTDERALECKRTLLRTVMEATPGVRRCLLKNVRQESTTCELEGDGFYVTVLRQTPAPAMAMTAVDEALSKKSIRRHFNKLSKMGELTAHTFTSADEVVPRLDGFFDQHVARWSDSPWPSLFVDPVHRRLFAALAKELGQAGLLRFNEIRLDDQLIAAHFGTMYAGVFTWYKPSYDPELAKLSPGEVLLKSLFERACDEGATEFDFTIGDEAFKSRFATTCQSVVDLHVTNSRLAAARLRARLRAKAGLRTLLDRMGLWDRLKRLAGRA